jgi:surface antigen
MNVSKKILALLAVVAISVTACTNTGTGSGPTINKEFLGGATGAILGGVVGSKVGKGTGQLVGVGVGTLLGTMVGSSIGASLDKADLMYADRANQRAYTAPVGETISWNNPDSGNSGTITPVRDGTSTNGRYCREYSQTITVDGKTQKAYGTACKNPDGTWQIVN